MKKALIAILLITTMVSCDTETHCFYPLIVEEVTTSFYECSEKKNKYRLSIKNNHGDKLYIFTDSLFQVGDTIK